MNDVWYGDMVGFKQYLFKVRIRVVENGILVVCVVNIGIFVIIDFVGCIIVILGYVEIGVLDGSFFCLLVLMFYSVFGDILFLLMIFSGVIVVIVLCELLKKCICLMRNF